MYNGTTRRRMRASHRFSNQCSDAHKKEVLIDHSSSGVSIAQSASFLQAGTKKVVGCSTGESLRNIIEMSDTMEELFHPDLNSNDAIRRDRVTSTNASRAPQDTGKLRYAFNDSHPVDDINRRTSIPAIDPTRNNLARPTKKAPLYAKPSSNFHELDIPDTQLRENNKGNVSRKEANMALFERLQENVNHISSASTKRSGSKNRKDGMMHTRAPPAIETFDAGLVAGREYHQIKGSEVPQQFVQSRRYTMMTGQQQPQLSRGDTHSISQKSRQSEHSAHSRSIDQQIFNKQSPPVHRESVLDNEIDVHKMKQLLTGQTFLNKSAGFVQGFNHLGVETRREVSSPAKQKHISYGQRTIEHPKMAGEPTNIGVRSGPTRRTSKPQPTRPTQDERFHISPGSNMPPRETEKNQTFARPISPRAPETISLDNASWFEHCRDSVVVSQCKKIRERRLARGIQAEFSYDGGYQTYDQFRATEFIDEKEQDMKHAKPSQSAKRKEAKPPTQQIGANIQKLKEKDKRPSQRSKKSGKVRVELCDMMIMKGGKVNLPLPYCAVPKNILDVINILPGNNKCIDCGNSEADNQPLHWASVSYGTLLCKHCAFRHITKSEEVRFLFKVCGHQHTTSILNSTPFLFCYSYVPLEKVPRQGFVYKRFIK